MQTNRRNFMAGSLLIGLCPAIALAEDPWPSRAIRVISAGSPGGGSDIFVRILEARLTKKLGQPLFIDNRPGAGGMTAAGIAASSPPDGHTLFVSNMATNAIGLALYAKPTFDPKKDLPPVARMATMSNAIAVRANAGIQTIQDLIAYMKANPKKAFYGSAGIGTSSHLTGHMFSGRVGVEGVHVPYKGTAANLNALLAGEVLFAADNLPLYVQHVKAGALKLLAVTQANRVDGYLDVPTVQEAAGIRPFDVFSWYGLSASTGTPTAIVERLGAEVVAALGDPAIQAAVRAVGAEPAPLGPAAYGAFIDAEIRKWSPIVKSSGAAV
jgi:tripartite-type tricarboxylate transporter receptor subunit TctC